MNRNISLDILKIILAFMVVGIHSGFLADISATGRFITVNGLFRIAVPIFLMINGFFFYSTLESGNTKKWFSRILMLYVFWTLFYIYFWFPDEINAFSLIKIIKTILVGHNHLWYLPAMIGAAACLILVKNFSTKALMSVPLLCFFTGTLIQYLGNYHFATNPTLNKLFNTLWVYRNFLFFAFPFFCIGYLLKRSGYYKKVERSHAIFVTIAGIAILLGESYFDFMYQADTEGFDMLASLIFVCPFIFLLALTSEVQGESKSIALYSTAIYFIHPLFISIYTHYFNLQGTVLAFVVAITSTIAATILIKINSKVKVML